MVRLVRRVVQFLAANSALAVIVAGAQLVLTNCLGPGNGRSGNIDLPDGGRVTGTARTAIERTGPGGHLTADAEGLTAARCTNLTFTRLDQVVMTWHQRANAWLRRVKRNLRPNRTAAPKCSGTTGGATRRVST